MKHRWWVCTTASAGANRRRALPQRLGRSLLFLSSFHTSNHAFWPRTLKQEQGTASMANTSGKAEPVRISDAMVGGCPAAHMVALQLPAAHSRVSCLPALCQHAPPAPSAAHPTGWPPRAEGAKCLQAPHCYPAAQLAMKQPSRAFCTGLWHKEEQCYTRPPLQILFLWGTLCQTSQNHPRPGRILKNS